MNNNNFQEISEVSKRHEAVRAAFETLDIYSDKDFFSDCQHSQIDEVTEQVKAALTAVQELCTYYEVGGILKRKEMDGYYNIALDSQKKLHEIDFSKDARDWQEICFKIIKRIHNMKSKLGLFGKDLTLYDTAIRKVLTPLFQKQYCELAEEFANKLDKIIKSKDKDYKSFAYMAAVFHFWCEKERRSPLSVQLWRPFWKAVRESVGISAPADYGKKVLIEDIKIMYFKDKPRLDGDKFALNYYKQFKLYKYNIDS